MSAIILGSVVGASQATTASPAVSVTTGTPTQITHKGAVFHGSWSHSGCCNTAVFAISPTPDFSSPIYDYVGDFDHSMTLLVRMQYGNIGEQTSGAVFFDGRDWGPTSNTAIALPDTTYYVRLGAQVGVDDLDCLWRMECYVWGNTTSFRTRSVVLPEARTGTAVAVSDVAARLTGSVISHDEDSIAMFEYSTSADLADSATSPSTRVRAGDESTLVGADISSLLPGTTYFFRIVSSNAFGVIRGEVRSFTTRSPAGLSINGGRGVTTSTRVVLNISAPLGATSMMVSNDGGFAGASVKPVAESMEWDLDELIEMPHQRVVYLRFFGPGVDSSRVHSDDILLDTRQSTTLTASISATSVARIGGLRVGPRSTVRVKILPTSAGRCRASGAVVRATSGGTCQVVVTVRSGRGRSATRAVTRIVTLRLTR